MPDMGTNSKSRLKDFLTEGAARWTRRSRSPSLLRAAPTHETFADSPPVKPSKSLGHCRVVACGQPAHPIPQSPSVAVPAHK